ncbi:MAG: ABC transporter permease subunit [Halobacteriaceae archaeon]
MGRSAVIAVTLGFGSLVTAGLVAATLAVPDPIDLGGVLGSIVLVGVAFAGVAVGISAAVRTRGKAMALAIGLLLIFLVIWDAVAALAYQAVTGSLPGLKVDAWDFLFLRVSPIAAFRALADGFVTGPLSGFFVWGLEQIPRDASPEQLTVANRVRGQLPFYLEDWFAALTLLVWGVVPAVLGYARFKDSDL